VDLAVRLPRKSPLWVIARDPERSEGDRSNLTVFGVRGRWKNAQIAALPSVARNDGSESYMPMGAPQVYELSAYSSQT
jgi:hypothetical protein